MDRLTIAASLALVLLTAGGSGCSEQRPATTDTAAAPAEWPQWRGPDRSGVSQETGLLAQWPEDGPALVWKATNAGSGFSTVAVSGGRVFTQGKRSDGGFVIAYDADDGRELWARRVGPRYSNSKGGGPRATPTVDGDRLYALGASGDLVCLASDTGEPLWSLNILEAFGGENIKWGLSESPLVDESHVYVLTGSAKGSIVALDKMTGKSVWQSAEMTDEPGYASALLRTVGGVRQIIHFTDAAAVGVRASDGKLLWRYEDASNGTANCATPVYHDDHVFVTSGYDTGAALLRLSSNGSETTAEEVYFTRDMKNHHGGVVLVDGHLYGFDGSNLTCLDFKTGERKWRDRSVGKGSLTAADGMLYLLSEKGVVGLARATPDGYQEVSRFSIDPGRRKSWAYPVVAGGRLYIRNGDEVLCFDVGAA